MIPSDDAQRQCAILRSRVMDLLTEEELLRKVRRSLETKVPLRIKLGVDPTAPDLHLGHTVVLHKLRQFQEFGHEVIFLIGDFTGMIGDPSSRSETRKPLTRDEVLRNAETYQRQVFKILDRDATRIEFNSRWMSQLRAEELIHIAAHHTVARMLEREDFRARMAAGRPISIHEFLYPLLQGYDSVVLKADVELGGTDQKFNLLVGRELQRVFGQEPQVVLTMPLLEGVDGVQKMSKSLGNSIGIDEPPREIFGKVMSLPDSLLVRYYTLVTPLDDSEVHVLACGLQDESRHPREVKAQLGKILVRLYHGEASAEAAAAEFDRVFRDRKTPEQVESIRVAATEAYLWLPIVLTQAGLASSNSSARRLIQQGAVEVDEKQIKDVNFELPTGREYLIRVGKKKFAKVLLG